MDLEARVSKVEKRLEATTKLVQAGMKMLVKMQQETREMKQETREMKQGTRELQKAQQETTEKINALIDAQMRTDVQIQTMSAELRAVGSKIDRLVDSWGKNRGNGHRR